MTLSEEQKNELADRLEKLLAEYGFKQLAIMATDAPFVSEGNPDGTTLDDLSETPYQFMYAKCDSPLLIYTAQHFILNAPAEDQISFYLTLVNHLASRSNV